MKYRIDVNILDDHTMVCEGLTDAINRSDVAHVSRTFNTIESCRQAFRERRPDVLLLDISIPNGDGAAFCQEVIESYPKVKVVAVTIHDEYSVIRRFTDLGIHGYVLKSSTVDTLLEAIVSVWQGRRYVSAEAETILQQGAAQAVSLTAVEQNILRLVCDGMTNPQIADQLNLSTETVNWYRKRLLTKFGVKNTVSLVRQALKEQLV
jgi:DNA-binding NarL/FixJ family response regulator